MNYLLDTNIISEIRKGRDCDPHVATWYDSIDDESIYISVLVLGEIRKALNGRAQQILAKLVLLRSGFLL